MEEYINYLELKVKVEYQSTKHKMEKIKAKFKETTQTDQNPAEALLGSRLPAKAVRASSRFGIALRGASKKSLDRAKIECSS